GGATSDLLEGGGCRLNYGRDRLRKWDAITTRSLWTRVGRANPRSRTLAIRRNVEPLTYAISFNRCLMCCSSVGPWEHLSRSNTSRCLAAIGSQVWCSWIALWAKNRHRPPVAPLCSGCAKTETKASTNSFMLSSRSHGRKMRSNHWY